MFRIALTFSVVVAAVSLSLSCKREERAFHVSPPDASVVYATSISDLRPGPGTEYKPVKNQYEDNAWAVSEGQRLYMAFNCVGCHAHGGGGMGPALMDDKWIYGSEPPQIFSSIVEGRPNGMPSFRGKIPDYQVWQLVAYVRSVGGLGTSGASPGRSGDLAGATPPSSMPQAR